MVRSFLGLHTKVSCLCFMRTVFLFFCRYEPESNELINDELGIAYPIIDGIPNMIPQEARLLQKDSSTSAAPVQE